MGVVVVLTVVVVGGGGGAEDGWVDGEITLQQMELEDNVAVRALRLSHSHSLAHSCI